MNVRRSSRGIGRARHRWRVGDPAGSSPGYVTVFVGWNVWELWRADDPDRGLIDTVWNLGIEPDRLLRIWVEDQLQTNAPGVAVADPMNPAALRGSQIQIIPSASGLAVAATRADVPELAGALQLGQPNSKASRVVVRFYNRGAQSVMPWPHDKNVMLEATYTPSSSNPITSGAAPSSLGGTASELAEDAKSIVKVIAIGGGLVLATVLVIALASNTRRAAA